MELGFWLVELDFVRTMDEAEVLCQRGSVRIDGNSVSNVHTIIKPGSLLGTLEHAYTIRVPSPFYEEN